MTLKVVVVVVGGGAWQIAHLPCSDTVPKYRAENGAEERDTEKTINIHSPSKEDWQKRPLKRNLVLS